MSIQNIVLLIAGAINLIMGVFIFSRGIKHNKVNLYFGLLTFFNFTWALGLFLSRSTTDLQLTALFTRSTYISALAIIISLLYFVIHFPYKDRSLALIKKVLIWLPAVALSILIYTRWFITHFVTAYSPYEYISYYYKPVFWFYAVYFVFIALLSIIYLLQKYQKAENIFKKQIKLLLITIVIGLALGSYFNLFIHYFENFRFNWLGPIFTVFMNMVVFGFIFSSKKK